MPNDNLMLDFGNTLAHVTTFLIPVGVICLAILSVGSFDEVRRSRGWRRALIEWVRGFMYGFGATGLFMVAIRIGGGFPGPGLPDLACGLIVSGIFGFLGAAAWIKSLSEGSTDSLSLSCQKEV